MVSTFLTDETVIVDESAVLLAEVPPSKKFALSESESVVLGSFTVSAAPSELYAAAMYESLA